MILCLFIGFTITLVSCSGEDGKDGINGEMGLQGEEGEQGPQGEQGEQGPQGEQGEQGEQGSQGEQGQSGEDGQSGSANVIVSDWMMITWTSVDNKVPPTRGEMIIEEVPGINDLNAFLDTGAVVLFYLRRDFGVATATSQFPYQDDSEHIYSYTMTTTDPDQFLAGLYIVGESINVTSMENSNNYLIRYVLVPADIAEASDLANNMPENFGEAATLLGLEQ